MRSITSLAVLSAFLFSTSIMAQGSNPASSDGQLVGSGDDDGLLLNAATDMGCYTYPGKMIDMGYYLYQTPGWCQPLCVRQSLNYFALVNGTTCFCGADPPSQANQVPDSNCNIPCKGDDKVSCGGTNFWDVQNANWSPGEPTGSQTIIVPTQTWHFFGAAASAASAAAASTTLATTTSGNPVATVVVTASAQTPTSTSSTSSSSGPNTAAIAAGVVVGIVALFAIVGGTFFYMRRRKQRSLAEEQRRHEMMTNFVTAEKPGKSYASSDARLDPSLMFQRRLSDGSIRDNEDYSRRILKVANPDA